MFDDIWGNFGINKKNQDSNSKKNKNEGSTDNENKNEFENLELIKKENAKPLYALPKDSSKNFLEVIMDDTNYDSDQEYEIVELENKNPNEKNQEKKRNKRSGLKNKLKKWRMTSESGLKTSSLAKTSSKNKNSGSKEIPNRRNFIMGLADDKKSAEVDLNSLMNHLENKKDELNSFLPKNLDFKVKDLKGNILEKFSFERKKINPPPVLFDTKVWKIGNTLIERTSPKEKSSDKYIGINYNVRTKND